MLERCRFVYDGQAGRFSESRDVTLTNRRQLVFEKINWFSRFVLTDAASGRPLGAADRSWFEPLARGLARPAYHFAVMLTKNRAVAEELVRQGDAGHGFVNDAIEADRIPKVAQNV